MTDKTNIFNILGNVIVLLVAILIVVNVLYIKSGCLNRNCLVIGVSTIALLLWATAFWLMVLRYSKKNK